MSAAKARRDLAEAGKAMSDRVAAVKLAIENLHNNGSISDYAYNKLDQVLSAPNPRREKYKQMAISEVKALGLSTWEEAPIWQEYLYKQT